MTLNVVVMRPKRSGHEALAEASPPDPCQDAMLPIHIFNMYSYFVHK